MAKGIDGLQESTIQQTPAPWWCYLLLQWHGNGESAHSTLGRFCRRVGVGDRVRVWVRVSVRPHIPAACQALLYDDPGWVRWKALYS